MTENGFTPLFAQNSLAGCHALPRLLPWLGPNHPRNLEAAKHTGLWTITEGVLEGRQSPPGCGYGAYLLTEGIYEDFILEFDAKPDWPCDTGIYLRATDDALTGYQVLVDHRRSGSLAGFYGTGLGGFHAIRWNVDAEYDVSGSPCRLKIESPEDTLEPIGPEKPALLTYSVPGEDFLRIWKWNDWNSYRVECRGELPKISISVNGIPVAAMDASTMMSDRFDREKALEKCRLGHIAIEVHDNDRMGEARWGREAACRWRNMRICRLS